MLVTNNTDQDYWFGPLHLPAGISQQITVDDTSSTSLYLTNDQVADAINNLSQFGSGKITCSSYALPFPRPTGVPQLLHGDGSPEGLVYASAGSLYMRRDVGSTGANGLYVKTTGITSSTGWQVYTVASAVSGLIQLYDSGYLAAPQPTLDTGAAGFSTAFTHLIVKLIARGDFGSGNVIVEMTFNGDTGPNYESDRMWVGQATAPAGGEDTGSYAVPLAGRAMPGAQGPADYFSVATIEIPFYAQPTANVYKSWTATSTGYSSQNYRVNGANGGWWNVAGTAISRITLTPASGNFVAGSRLMVYAYN